MWIFFNNAMISTVTDRNDKSKLLVRARVKGDLEEIFGADIEVIELDEADYQFRAFIDRNIVAETIKNEVEGIKYTNFKDSVDNSERGSYYMRVWATMWDYQESLSQRFAKYVKSTKRPTGASDELHKLEETNGC